MICFPTAKINLGLRITDKRPDGFHNLETIYYPIGLKDALEIVPSTENTDYQLIVSGIPLDANLENNLVTKAFRLLQQSYPIKPVTAYLYKAIPSGAGLGGGSSDAAFMLKLVSDAQQLNASQQELERLASVLGSDCPFFIGNRAVFASGTGNVFEPTTVSLEGWQLVLIKPDVKVSTAEAYASVKPEHPEQSLNNLIRLPVNDWKKGIINDFETYVFKKYPVVGTIKQQLYDKGAVYASMTGSGSAVYGLFEQPVDFRKDFPDFFYWSEML
jgi:4-diphosphocytidyl-2-C-methyl-D-erythritol kinase